MNDRPEFPPLLTGIEAPPGQAAFDKAVAQATLGCDGGTVVYAMRDDALEAALVLAPECSLADAMAMVMVAGLGCADALGALAPPEVGVHLCWPDGIRVNGARCGGFRAMASDRAPDVVPDWIVIGLTLPFMALGGNPGDNPGDNPDQTTLYEEGCADVLPKALLESWTRHSLTWINRWSDDGMPPIHEAWRAKAHGMGEDISVTLGGTPHEGVFVGLDERGGLLLRQGAETNLIPLTDMLET